MRIPSLILASISLSIATAQNSVAPVAPADSVADASVQTKTPLYKSVKAAAVYDTVTSGPVPQLPVLSADETNIPLTLDQCISIALTDNPTVKVADIEVERYDYSKKETLGQLFPSLNFSFAYNRTIAKQVTYMDMGAFEGLGGLGGGGTTPPAGDETVADDVVLLSRADSSSKNTGIKMGLDNSYNTGFSLSMPVIAPQLWKSLKLSDSQILEKIEASRASRLSLVNQIKSAYYGLLLAQDSYRVMVNSYEMAKFTADIYAKKFSLGAASEFDVLRTEVAVKNIEPNLLQSEIAVRGAKLQLLLLMGLDAKLNIEATDSLGSYTNGMYEYVLGLNQNIEQNSDLRKFDIQTRELNDALEIQKMAWWPTVALTANYTWTAMNNGAPFKGLRWSPYSMVGLAVSLPLFNGGQRYYKIKQAEFQIDQMTWQREYLVHSINTQVELQIDNINKNVKQISSCQETVKQAEKAYDIQKKGFEIGATSYLDYRDAELAVTQSQLAYYQAIYNYLVACSELELLLGTADVEKYMPVRE